MNFNPYELLGLNRDATNKDIKTAYKEKSLLHHPDKDSGNSEKFANCTVAKDLLLDSDRRNTYDRGGWNLVKQRDDMIRQREQQNVPKCESITLSSQITIKQIYNKTKIKIIASIPQYEENGTHTNKAFELELQIESEMIERPLMIQGQGISRPDHQPGDIIVNVKLTPDPSLSEFKIEGKHLILEVPLKLSDIIDGYTIVLNHPDGNTYSISGHYEANDETSIRVLPKMGLPARDEPGDLIIKPVLDISSLTTLPRNVKTDLSRFISSYTELHSHKLGTTNTEDITSKAKSIEEMQRAHHHQIHVNGNHVMMGNGPQCGVQ